MKKWTVKTLSAVCIILAPTAGYAQVSVDEYMQQACSVNAIACKDGIALAGKLIDCLELPANAPSTFKMLARVMLKDGEATFSNIVFDTVQLSPWEKLAAVAITDAITACEPYATLSGPVVFLVTPSLLP
jgi:hypothetical protein